MNGLREGLFAPAGQGSGGDRGGLGPAPRPCPEAALSANPSARKGAFTLR